MPGGARHTRVYSLLIEIEPRPTRCVDGVPAASTPKSLGRKRDAMRRAAVGIAISLLFGSIANAKCTGPSYPIRLGTEISIHRDSDGGDCVHRLNRSIDPIYGTIVTSKPKHGSIETRNRITIVYHPSHGFKGEDSYVFQWVGKQGGTTPSALTVNVSVTVR
jgi:hypothetical protein